MHFFKLLKDKLETMIDEVTKDYVEDTEIQKQSRLESSSGQGAMI